MVSLGSYRHLAFTPPLVLLRAISIQTNGFSCHFCDEPDQREDERVDCDIGIADARVPHPHRHRPGVPIEFLAKVRIDIFFDKRLD